MDHPPSISNPGAADAADPLAHFRDRFAFPVRDDGAPWVYLCGHSLGLQPLGARHAIAQELDDWARLGVEGHFRARTAWVAYHECLAESIARIVGATPREVVTMNSLTVNLHLMLVSFYRPIAGRHRILIERMAFPSDRYAVESQVRFHGFDPSDAVLDAPAGGGTAACTTDDILDAIDRGGDGIALLLLGGVQYYSGGYFDCAAITAAAHARGIIVGIDAAHAAGNVPLRLHDWDVDFAVWCSYKYLNGGPGAVGGCFVHERHARRTDLPRFAGWWGHDKESRFRMDAPFDPIPGAEGWQLSNAPILSMAAVRASMEIFDEAGMERLREKSVRLTGYLESLLLPFEGVDWRILTPRDPARRGAQLSFQFLRNGRDTFTRLTDAGVLCDWREPDVIRIAPAPLYNSFSDVRRVADILTGSMTETARDA